jgi:hypothetical protein
MSNLEDSGEEPYRGVEVNDEERRKYDLFHYYVNQYCDGKEGQEYDDCVDAAAKRVWPEES